LKKTISFLKDVFSAILKAPAENAITRKEAFDANDNFFLLLYGDLLGIPNPISYYALELLPYLAPEIEGWERRIQNRASVIEEKAAQFNF
jgi:hypothetical protein